MESKSHSSKIRLVAFPYSPTLKSGPQSHQECLRLQLVQPQIIHCTFCCAICGRKSSVVRNLTSVFDHEVSVEWQIDSVHAKLPQLGTAWSLVRVIPENAFIYQRPIAESDQDMNIKS